MSEGDPVWVICHGTTTIGQSPIIGIVADLSSALRYLLQEWSESPDDFSKIRWTIYAYDEDNIDILEGYTTDTTPVFCLYRELLGIFPEKAAAAKPPDAAEGEA